jgi:hypothetical protein
MTPVHKLLTAAVLLAASACTSPPPAKAADMDIDFIRGCWVQKESPGGKIEAFLRLLPDREAPAGTLTGQISDVSTHDWITNGVFHFARDGETVTFDARDMPEQPAHTRIDPARLSASFDWARPKHGGRFAAFAGPAPSRSFLFTEGGGERLAIWAVSAEPEATLVYTLFDGERDGCD